MPIRRMLELSQISGNGMSSWPLSARGEFQIVRPGLAFWQAYDPSVKTELSCCAVETLEGLVFVDPVRLAPEALEELLNGPRPAGALC